MQGLNIHRKFAIAPDSGVILYNNIITNGLWAWACAAVIVASQLLEEQRSTAQLIFNTDQLFAGICSIVTGKLSCVYIAIANYTLRRYSRAFHPRCTV